MIRIWCRFCHPKNVGIPSSTCSSRRSSVQVRLKEKKALRNAKTLPPSNPSQAFATPLSHHSQRFATWTKHTAELTEHVFHATTNMTSDICHLKHFTGTSGTCHGICPHMSPTLTMHMHTCGLTLAPPPTPTLTAHNPTTKVTTTTTPTPTTTHVQPHAWHVFPTVATVQQAYDRPCPRVSKRGPIQSLKCLDQPTCSWKREEKKRIARTTIANNTANKQNTTLSFSPAWTPANKQMRISSFLLGPVGGILSFFCDDARSGVGCHCGCDFSWRIRLKRPFPAYAKLRSNHLLFYLRIDHET